MGETVAGAEEKLRADIQIYIRDLHTVYSLWLDQIKGRWGVGISMVTILEGWEREQLEFHLLSVTLHAGPRQEWERARESKGVWRPRQFSCLLSMAFNSADSDE